MPLNRPKAEAILQIDNERVISRRVIANKFNNYFVSLAAKMNTEAFENYTYVDESPSFEYYMPKSCEASIFLDDCEISEILETITETHVLVNEDK